MIVTLRLIFITGLMVTASALASDKVRNNGIIKGKQLSRED